MALDIEALQQATSEANICRAVQTLTATLRTRNLGLSLDELRALDDIVWKEPLIWKTSETAPIGQAFRTLQRTHQALPNHPETSKCR